MQKKVITRNQKQLGPANKKNLTLADKLTPSATVYITDKNTKKKLVSLANDSRLKHAKIGQDINIQAVI